jgi:hypothetical protein
MTIFYFLIGDFPNLEGQVPAFISPRNRVAQLYQQALGYIAPARTEQKTSLPLLRVLSLPGKQLVRRAFP